MASELVMVGSAWRHKVAYAPRDWQIGRCTACSFRYAWERNHAPVACLDCGAPLHMTRRYSRFPGDGWVLVQHSDVGFSEWKARGYRALKEAGKCQRN